MPNQGEAGRDSESVNPSGILAPAPMLALASFLVGVGVHLFRPVMVFPAPWNLLGVVLVLVGVAVLASALYTMRGAGKSPPHEDEPQELITHGVFRYTRNPLYLGVITVYVGLTAVLNSVWPFVTLVPLVLYFDRVAKREERYLEDRFGDEFTKYQENVRRWL